MSKGAIRIQIAIRYKTNEYDRARMVTGTTTTTKRSSTRPVSFDRKTSAVFYAVRFAFKTLGRLCSSRFGVMRNVVNVRKQLDQDRGEWKHIFFFLNSSCRKSIKCLPMLSGCFGWRKSNEICLLQKWLKWFLRKVLSKSRINHRKLYWVDCFVVQWMSSSAIKMKSAVKMCDIYWSLLSSGVWPWFTVISVD